MLAYEMQKTALVLYYISISSAWREQAFHAGVRNVIVLWLLLLFVVYQCLESDFVASTKSAKVDEKKNRSRIENESLFKISRGATLEVP
jgi:hypothetical protein